MKGLMITECNNDDITILQGRTGHEVHSAELVMVILYPANLRRIMINYCLLKTPGSTSLSC